ncbi:hypothetical protein JCM19037_4079 [Geomicrobium sp. JCM 19037]|uniref:hypothetical protein n=1 Tax=Geomicrobium sp. JCM 19037 TaxID=1460634 RepID=UPI00045F3CF5|nr:hypothetical protein [Geomicrobium sp. JCM 19037]GAK05570.1 hypothetical protein JCM19037_4079 [Geomicrobium sp. JCM 19037]
MKILQKVPRFVYVILLWVIVLVQLSLTSVVLFFEGRAGSGGLTQIMMVLLVLAMIVGVLAGHKTTRSS